MIQTQYSNGGCDSQVPGQLSLRPTRRRDIYKVILDLPSKRVRVGEIDSAGEGCFRCKRKREHLHRKFNAWGINAEVLSRWSFRWVSITCDGVEYKTTRTFLQQFGKAYTFSGYEKQLFLPLELWGIDVVKDYEKKQAQQLQLFGDAA